MNRGDQDILTKKSLIELLSERWVAEEALYAKTLLRLYRFEAYLSQVFVPSLEKHQRWIRRIALSGSRIDALRDARDVGSSALPQDNTVPWRPAPNTAYETEPFSDELDSLLVLGLGHLLPELKQYDVSAETINQRLTEFGNAYFSSDSEVMALILEEVGVWTRLPSQDEPVSKIRHAAQLRRLIKDTESRLSALKPMPLYQLMESLSDANGVSDLQSALELEIDKLAFLYLGQHLREAQLWAVVDR